MGSGAGQASFLELGVGFTSIQTTCLRLKDGGLLWTLKEPFPEGESNKYVPQTLPASSGELQQGAYQAGSLRPVWHIGRPDLYSQEWTQHLGSGAMAPVK